MTSLNNDIFWTIAHYVEPNEFLGLMLLNKSIYRRLFPLIPLKHKQFIKKYTFPDPPCVFYSFPNGLKHGPYKEWDNNNNLRVSCYYKYGKIHGTFETKKHYKRFNHIGKLVEECEYNAGSKHGMYYEYNSIGLPMKKIRFINDCFDFRF
jgi:hypothetical protein